MRNQVYQKGVSCRSQQSKFEAEDTSEGGEKDALDSWDEAGDEWEELGEETIDEGQNTGNELGENGANCAENGAEDREILTDNGKDLTQSRENELLPVISYMHI